MCNGNPCAVPKVPPLVGFELGSASIASELYKKLKRLSRSGHQTTDSLKLSNRLIIHICKLGETPLKPLDLCVDEIV